MSNTTRNKNTPVFTLFALLAAIIVFPILAVVYVFGFIIYLIVYAFGIDLCCEDEYYFD